MTSLYSTIEPHFTQELLTPGLRIGYHDEGGLWPFIFPSLTMRLPLRAIEWKNLVGVTQTIDRLPLHFVPDLGTESMAPLVCINVIKCEEMDRYKSTIRPQIALWIDSMNAAKVDWMLLYVPLGTRGKAGGRTGNSNIYKKIFDKIRLDFSHKKTTSGGSASGMSGGVPGSNGSTGTGGNSVTSSPLPNLSHLSSSLTGAIGSSVHGNGPSADRICKIEALEGTSVVGVQQQSQHEVEWVELLIKLRKCIMEAFEMKCVQYEEEVRVLDTKRSSPSWDFGTFFVAKERLALMYQQTYLMDDAIRHLDELEAIFLTLTQSDKRFADTTRICHLTADSSIFTVAPLALDMLKTYREIASNQSSALFMRLYFFSRQIRTLYLMGDFAQLIQRAITFIASFHEMLEQIYDRTYESADKSLKWFHAPQWAVGACLEVAYACELSWSGHDYQLSSASVPEGATFCLTPEVLARHLGDLLYLARRYLKRASQVTGWWNMVPPPIKPKESEGESAPLSIEMVYAAKVDASNATPTSWYHSLQNVFLGPSCDPFQRCVWEISHLASLHFSRAGRHRMAVFLGGECARYHFRHNEYESASRLFRSHARQCEEDNWWELVRDCVHRICDSELALGRSVEAVAACFSMLEITQADHAPVSRAYLEQLLAMLVVSLGHEGSTSSAKMGQLIKSSVTIETMQSPRSDLDYGDVRVTVALSNRFPAGIHIEKIRVKFTHISTHETKDVVENEKITEDLCELSTLLHEPSVVDIELEENNVYLYERASVSLIFLYGDVDVGKYACTGLDCCIAGNSFELASAQELLSVQFVIPARESTLDLQIRGPPLLIPASMEQIQITIQTHNDAVEKGILEISVSDNFTMLSLLESRFCVADGMSETMPIIKVSKNVEGDLNETYNDDGNDGNRWKLVIPSLQARTFGICTLSIMVTRMDALTPQEVGDDITISAVFRYDQASSSSTTPQTTQLRRSELVFAMVPALSELIRLKRVGDRVFVGATLTCNAKCGLRICDYELQCHANPDTSESPVRVDHDPNTHLTNYLLAPGQVAQMAFVLHLHEVDNESTIPDNVMLRIGIEYGSDTIVDSHLWWQSNCCINVPLFQVQGPFYHIEISPKKCMHVEGTLQFCVGEEISFIIKVTEEWNSKRQCDSQEMNEDTIMLCLDECSDGNWILMGKQEEQCVFSAEYDSTVHKRSFTTSKKLLPTRVGRVQFPQFQLRCRAPKFSSTKNPFIPGERVFCAQRAKTAFIM